MSELTGAAQSPAVAGPARAGGQLCAREECHGALLFLDLDNFQGHQRHVRSRMGRPPAGSRVAERLQAGVRSVDTVARLGGDEFVLILQHLHSVEPEAAVEAEAIAQKVIASLNEPFQVDKREIHSTPSIGIALFRDAQQSVHELLQRADLAMYQAKVQGRNTLCFLTPPCRPPPAPVGAGGISGWRCSATSFCCTTSRW